MERMEDVKNSNDKYVFLSLYAHCMVGPPWCDASTLKTPKHLSDTGPFSPPILTRNRRKRSNIGRFFDVLRSDVRVRRAAGRIYWICSPAWPRIPIHPALKAPEYLQVAQVYWGLKPIGCLVTSAPSPLTAYNLTER